MLILAVTVEVYIFKIARSINIKPNLVSKDIYPYKPLLITSFSEASNRCLDLSEGCLYPVLIEALEECLVKYLERFSNLVSAMIF